MDSLVNGWAHLMDTSKGTGRYVSANYLVHVRDYSASEGEPDDPVEPPRTSQIDGRMTVIIDPGHATSAQRASTRYTTRSTSTFRLRNICKAIWRAPV